MPDLMALWGSGLRLGALCLRGELKEPGITAQATAGFSPWWHSALLRALKHGESSCATTNTAVQNIAPFGL